MVTIVEATFVITLAHTIVGMKSRPHTLRGTKLVSVHTKMPKEVNKIFAGQPSDPKKRRIKTTKTSKTFKIFLIMKMDLGRPPLPLDRPYCQPLNYPEYVKDYDPYALVRIFKTTIRTNGETEDVEIVNLFSFTLINTMPG
jgi:hypothetical protein